MPLVNTGRKHLSELLKGISKFQNDAAVNYHFATVNAEGAGDVDNIGTLLKWSDSDSAFLPLVVNADWLASTVTAIGDVVKPTTQNGLEYVAIVAATTNDTEGEPTFPTVVGATVTETDGVVWLARLPYGADRSSPLPDGASICVSVGAAEGVGFNKTATTLSGTSVSMTVLFRGQAGIVEVGIEGFLALPADDQAEIKGALERAHIAVDASAEVIVSSHVVA